MRSPVPTLLFLIVVIIGMSIISHSLMSVFTNDILREIRDELRIINARP